MKKLVLTLLLGITGTLASPVNAQNMKPLTPEERRVIVEKGTERLSAATSTITRNGVTTVTRLVWQLSTVTVSLIQGRAGYCLACLLYTSGVPHGGSGPCMAAGKLWPWCIPQR